MIRLAIVTSHPIQYNAPLFREVARQPGLAVRVFYCWQGPAGSMDPQFGRPVAWDLPLLEGYDHVLVPNQAADPGTHHFGGLDNPGMVAAIQDWGADVLLVYGWAHRTLLKVLRRFHGRRPVLFRGDSNLHQGGGFHSHHRRRMPGGGLLRRLALRWILSHVDGAFPVGVLNRAYYQTHGLQPEQLYWVPHSIDDRRFADQDTTLTAQAADLRHSLGIGDQATVLLFAGKLVPWKDPDLLLEVTLELLEDHPDDLALLFVGDGERRSALEQRAGGRRGIHFLAFQNQTAMPRIYRSGDLLVLPSWHETWGLAVNEAMACGRAAVVSDQVGCQPDLVIPGQTGAVFHQGDAGDLRRVLRPWIGQRTQALALGNQARRHSADWSMDRAARRLAWGIGHFVRHGVMPKEGEEPPHTADAVTGQADDRK
ncbi:MAG: glycosyltransferase family 4 protein [Magnetococcales bacterium]|nr:glycosyltransferase family 4 protein [Magnetococcales bacterium]